MPREVPDGLYDDLVTHELEEALNDLQHGRKSVVEDLSVTDAARAIGRHVGGEIERVLASLPGEDKTEAARALAAELLDRLASSALQQKLDARPITDQRLPAPARRLLAVHRGAHLERPQTPLATSALLTNSSKEPAIGHELASEVGSADRIDAIVAFITMGGVRRIQDQLESFVSRGHTPRLRVLTTTFTGTTEVVALERLARLPGAEVKVSFDTQRTRLHAKAWLFHRNTGLTTAYIGSANLTATALADGREWMMKISSRDLPHVVQQFEATFDNLWADPEFERYDPANELQHVRLLQALRTERSGDHAHPTTLVELRPRAFQEELLDRLRACRELHGRTRNLIVAATGTGKTVIAAIDYARLAAAAGVRPRLLFLAHRREILERARDTFRHAVQDGAFGELAVGGEVPARYEHVFATVQSAAAIIDRLGRSHFRHVVVDECHHMPAASYQSLVPRLQPDQLVGLTGTPERSDGKSLLPDFGGHVAAELRLWTALDQQLLAPFEYYGISDGTDLRRIRWSRTGYDLAALADLYTGHTARADLVVSQLLKRVGSARGVRAIGFCVSVEHAEFMAAHFTERGVPSLALHGQSSAERRADAPRRLRDREVNVLFTCDLYNEGVDLPFVDTLLLLRPTMSATLFMQQLGRGLRQNPSTGKTTCLVLDFIGQHNESFRFDATLAGLTGVPKPALREAVNEGFPYLPSGCSVVLDSVARSTILASLKTSLAGAKKLASELRELSARSDRPLRLAEFLEESGRELEDVYDGKSYGWREVQALAGVCSVTDEDADLSRRFGWLLHIDEPTRIRHYAAMLNGGAIDFGNLSAADRRRWLMLEYQIAPKGELRAAEEVAEYLTQRPAAIEELNELQEVLEERIGLSEDVYPVPAWPLALHRHYKRREIVAAIGYVQTGKSGSIPQGGILKVPGDERRELLFVTIDKSGKGFSPTTRYRDYVISRDRFHWETQAAASVSRPSGQRYIDASLGHTFYLFVRATTDAAYAFLGPVRYVSHTGDRPIGITWALEHALPGSIMEKLKSVG